MGMFDITGTAPTKPMYAKDLYAAGQNIIADQMAPGIKRMTGYESPKRQAMAIANQADLSSMKSIQSTYKKLQQVNAGAASAWLKEALDTYGTSTQRMTAETARANAMGKKAFKADTKFDAATGTLTYVNGPNAGQRVPGFGPKPVTSKDSSERDLPQMTAVTYEQIKKDVNDVFDYALWDFTSPDAPGGISEKQLINFIFGYEQITNTGRAEIIDGIKDGTIDPTKPIPKKQSSGVSSNARAATNPFAVAAVPK